MILGRKIFANPIQTDRSQESKKFCHLTSKYDIYDVMEPRLIPAKGHSSLTIGLSSIHISHFFFF